MAGTIIADFIRADANKFSINVGNTIIASVNALGILSNTGNVMISSSGTYEANNMYYNGSSVLTSGRVKSSFQPTGSVLQVVSATKTDTFSSSSSTWVDVTGLSVDITPSSTSNKILIIAQLAAVNQSTTGSGAKIVRNGSNVVSPTSSGNRNITNFGEFYGYSRSDGFIGMHFNYLDSPASTSLQTYKIQINPNSYNMYVNRSVGDTDSTGFSRGVSTLTVMEIVG